MKILFTGASSFTGYWFVKTLAAAGHEITCPVTKNLSDYAETRGQRIKKLKPLCKLIPHAIFGSGNFLKIIRQNNFDLLCHHAADVTNYKSPHFDASRALQNNTHNLRAVLEVMKSNGLRAVILTGTVFENDEGAGSEPLIAASPYGLSKALTFEAFRDACKSIQMTLGKFVIPNPFGPFEEARFTAYLLQNWRAGKIAEVKTPDYVRDNIHVDLLAMTYATFAKRTILTKESFLKMNPSGYIEKQGSFAQRVARELQTRTHWTCDLKLSQQEDFNEPLTRTNTEPAVQFAPDWTDAQAWDAFAEYYRRQPRLP